MVRYTNDHLEICSNDPALRPILEAGSSRIYGRDGKPVFNRVVNRRHSNTINVPDTDVKENQAIFMGVVGCGLRMIWLDQDVLPSGYSNWDTVYRDMVYQFGDRAVIIRTIGGIDKDGNEKPSKVKAGILVSAFDSPRVNLETLRDVFGSELVDLCDHKGIRRCYIHRANVMLLNWYIATATPTVCADASFDWKLQAEPSEEVYAKHASKRNKAARAVMHFIASKYSDDNIVALPQEMVAEATDCAVSSIHTAIKHLIKSGFMEVADSSFKRGVKSMTYRILCPDFLREFSLRQKPVMPAPDKAALSQMFYDGNWFNALVASAKAFDNQFDYMSFVAQRPGFGLKRREQKAINVWKHYSAEKRKAKAAAMNSTNHLSNGVAR